MRKGVAAGWNKGIPGQELWELRPVVGERDLNCTMRLIIRVFANRSGHNRAGEPEPQKKEGSQTIGRRRRRRSPSQGRNFGSGYVLDSGGYGGHAEIAGLAFHTRRQFRWYWVVSH